MPVFPQEQFELYNIDLQTEEMVRPRNTAWHTDHLGFLEAMAWTGLAPSHRTRCPGLPGTHTPNLLLAVWARQTQINHQASLGNSVTFYSSGSPLASLKLKLHIHQEISVLVKRNKLLDRGKGERIVPETRGEVSA